MCVVCYSVRQTNDTRMHVKTTHPFLQCIINHSIHTSFLYFLRMFHNLNKIVLALSGLYTGQFSHTRKARTRLLTEEGSEKKLD